MSDLQTDFINSLTNEQIQIIQTLRNFTIYSSDTSIKIIKLNMKQKATENLNVMSERYNQLRDSGLHIKDPKLYDATEDEKELWTLYQKIYRTVNTRNKSQTVEIKFEQILPQPISPSLPKIKNN